MARDKRANETKLDYQKYLFRRNFEDLDNLNIEILEQEIERVWEEAQKQLLKELCNKVQSVNETDKEDLLLYLTKRLDK